MEEGSGAEAEAAVKTGEGCHIRESQTTSQRSAIAQVFERDIDKIQRQLCARNDHHGDIDDKCGSTKQTGHGNMELKGSLLHLGGGGLG